MENAAWCIRERDLYLFDAYIQVTTGLGCGERKGLKLEDETGHRLELTTDVPEDPELREWVGRPKWVRWW